MGSNVSSQFKQIFVRKNREIQSISAQIERARKSGNEEKHEIYLESDSINSFSNMKQVRELVVFTSSEIKSKLKVKVCVIFTEILFYFYVQFVVIIMMRNGIILFEFNENRKRKMFFFFFGCTRMKRNYRLRIYAVGEKPNIKISFDRNLFLYGNFSVEKNQKENCE